VRTDDQQKKIEAIAHARKYLVPYKDTYPEEIKQASGLLACPPGSNPTYNVWLISLIVHHGQSVSD
jgi:hypothetical protein